ncbi:hypothetical protein [Chryseobacterium indoltheticum]|nr:hypothetical protein [Chryseobacterium indoltheticum]
MVFILSLKQIGQSKNKEIEFKNGLPEKKTYEQISAESGNCSSTVF